MRLSKFSWSKANKINRFMVLRSGTIVSSCRVSKRLRKIAPKKIISIKAKEFSKLAFQKPFNDVVIANEIIDEQPANEIQRAQDSGAWISAQRLYQPDDRQLHPFLLYHPELTVPTTFRQCEILREYSIKYYLTYH